MQLQNLSMLTLRIISCLQKCESQLVQTELNTEIVSCLSDAAHRIHEYETITNDIVGKLNSLGTKNVVAPWADYICVVLNNKYYYVRWFSDDKKYYILDYEKRNWIEEQDSDLNNSFCTYADAKLAALTSPEPPGWDKVCLESSL